MAHRNHVNIHRLVHRTAAAVVEAVPVGIMDHAINIAVPSRIVAPRADSTSSTTETTGACGKNACEKPVSSSTYTIPVVLGVVLPLVGAAVVFLILHRRHVRKQREEDANDRHASLDFGMGNVPRAKRNLPKSNMHLDDDEKEHRSRRQLSMDMTMSNPYLLPPELHNSRESIHSLSRSLHQKEDPYRPQYHPGDNYSIRSQSKQGSSIYTGSSHAPSRLQDLATADLLSHAEPMPRSTPPVAFIPPPRQNSLPKDKGTSEFDAKSSPPYPLPSEPSRAHIVEPVQGKGLGLYHESGLPPQQPTQPSRDSYAGDTAALRKSNNYLGAFINDRDLDLSLTAPSNTTPASVERPVERQVVVEPPRSPSPPPPAQPNYENLPANTLPSNPRPPRKESAAVVQPQVASFVDNESDYGDGFEVTPPSPDRNSHANPQAHRYSMDVPPEEYVQAGLGAPGFDARRLSMGFRPLPPDAATEHDDPEVRANRIRSFYKEYFDESKPAPAGQYYEDYDQNYLDHTSHQQQGYYDPMSNSFVMPYAEPVTRRAMTPPPGGYRMPPRFQGGGPRPRNGSIGAMSTMSGGGRRGPQMYPPGPYPPGPRAFSSASGHISKPKRPLPPPSPLNTLPTPSKLKDDSFALMNSLEFAPPQTFRDRVQGRSESPLGERRPYSPAVPSYKPIASSYDELSTMPSPHLLRKSGTFTGLDFAPPKRFRDADNMSDAGSIRSNRSGVSAMHSQAIRNGAYRVSKIPQDMVFTKDDLATTLKPQWGMRQGS